MRPSAPIFFRLAFWAAVGMILATSTTILALSRSWQASDVESLYVVYSMFSQGSMLNGYLMDLNDAGTQPLMYDGQPAVDPACSPDGETMTFIVSDRIYRLRAEGQIESWDLRAATENNSNRGRYTTLRITENDEIVIAPWYLRRFYVIDPGGAFRPVPLEHFQSSGDMTVSPDGRQVAMPFVRQNMPKIQVVSTQDGSVQTVIDLAMGAAWSPDGSIMSVISVRDGYSVLRFVDTGQGVRYDMLAPTQGSFFTDLTWSPDGQALLYLYYSSNPPELHLWMDGGRLHRVVTTLKTSIARPCILRFRPEPLLMPDSQAGQPADRGIG